MDAVFLALLIGSSILVALALAAVGWVRDRLG